ncbi:hypothetical protein FOZ61_009164 [Perkinsus olseni]|uniref:Uncharacterized protein n=1 Tax=Perkinsus olseni TaxID=32597 RepID=A0A7J6MMV8_PEROL|nr:hypothetical protein FOZ61_009164 [Perkinsus olseni]KAF4672844.1 hypothetical protein FOL46_008284 [Perkinsus olseni]
MESSSSSRSSGPKFALDGCDFIRNMICESGFLGIMGYATYFGLLESSDMKEEDVIKAVRSHWLELADVKPSRGILDELFSLEVDGTVAQNIDTKDKIVPLARDPNTEGPVTRSQLTLRMTLNSVSPLKSGDTRPGWSCFKRYEDKRAREIIPAQLRPVSTTC